MSGRTRDREEATRIGKVPRHGCAEKRAQEGRATHTQRHARAQQGWAGRPSGVRARWRSTWRVTTAGWVCTYSTPVICSTCMRISLSSSLASFLYRSLAAGDSSTWLISCLRTQGRRGNTSTHVHSAALLLRMPPPRPVCVCVCVSRVKRSCAQLWLRTVRVWIDKGILRACVCMCVYARVRARVCVCVWVVVVVVGGGSRC